MMDNKLYYEFSDSLGDKKNQHGFVTHGVPFLESRNAIQYVMDEHPFDVPENHSIVYDPKLCADLARPLYVEAQYMIEKLNELKDRHREKLDNMSEEFSKLSDKDLLESVHKTVLHEYLHEEMGICQGLSLAWDVLNERRHELFLCARLKGE